VPFWLFWSKERTVFIYCPCMSLYYYHYHIILYHKLIICVVYSWQ